MIYQIQSQRQNKNKANEANNSKSQRENIPLLSSAPQSHKRIFRRKKKPQVNKPRRLPQRNQQEKRKKGCRVSENLQNHRTNNSSNKTQRRSISNSDSTVRLGRRRAGRSLGGRTGIRTLAGLGIGDLLLASELSLDVLLDVLGELVAADVVGGLEVEVAGDFLEFGEVDPEKKKKKGGEWLDWLF